ncbi:SH3 and multiple ankyrin repeat domains protein 1 [Armadillidium nasatum]|uniref:SH3 and multiple ankyrin repeat domains protein 1 n=1 Tax=Armadillidium nasatum TaxID=96803 RepID=A0A5N5SUV9_9CRUS|nr:SH3 and multiple ankyrin repeat domains protein 1 [Armadillidium nasatum]
MLHLDEKSLRPLHSRASLRRFLEYVKENNVEKVAKLCAKGLDPNFHCQESGETPLTIGARLKKGGKMIMSLVNGGALLDYRTKEGLTPMHRAVQSDNFEAVKTLLDLGASPNYRDIRGLTPLYYSVTHATDPMLCEALLHDYSIIGASDNQGWQETHQACRNKLVQHLEHLLFYGADMNAQNASGNTPLHVCAVNNLEDCARVLLFRGCDKNALNYANQTPYQVAVIAGNMELAQIIQNHLPSSVVPYKEPPKYNPKRRISGVPLSRAQSDPRLEVCIVNKPPSPTPSNRSIPPFSSASSLSETSTGSGSTCTHPSEADSEECPSGVGSSGINPGKTFRNFININLYCTVSSAHENSDIVSDSSGVCTSNSGSNDSYDSTIGVNSSSSMLALPDVTNFSIGMLVVCLKQYTPHTPGQLDINPGEIIEVTASTDDGMLEGCLKGKSGLFPPQCVQEIRLRNPKSVRENIIGRVQSRNGSMSSSCLSDTSTISAPGTSQQIQQQQQQQQQQQYQQPQQYHQTQIYGTTPRMKKSYGVFSAFLGLKTSPFLIIENNDILMLPEPRFVTLHRGKKGFGFVLRGAKATSPLIERPYERGPALQYLDDVDPGGVADEAGLKKGDYLLKINGEDVSQASHEHVVNVIKKSGDVVHMSVISPPSISFLHSKGGQSQSLLPTHSPVYPLPGIYKRGSQTLPRKFNAVNRELHLYLLTVMFSNYDREIKKIVFFLSSNFCFPEIIGKVKKKFAKVFRIFFKSIFKATNIIN